MIDEQGIAPGVAAGDATKNSKATTGLVLGIIGLVSWLIPIIGAPITIIGLIFGIRGLKSLKRGAAITGIVLSSIGLLAAIVNALIGAYQGATGQNVLINKFLNRGNQETQTGSAETRQAYSNARYGFKINPPKGWQVDESGQFGAPVIFFNPETDQEGATPFSANINVIRESAQGLNLNDYSSVTKEALFESLQNYKSTEDKSVSVNGMQARMIGGTFAQSGLSVRNLQLIAVKGDNAFVVTGTALESAWNKYQDLIESSLLTFSLD